MLSCKEQTEAITDYMERRMSLAERTRFRLHLVRCRRCQAYLRQMRCTVATLARLPRRSVDADVMGHLLRQFRGSSAS